MDSSLLLKEGQGIKCLPALYLTGIWFGYTGYSNYHEQRTISDEPAATAAISIPNLVRGFHPVILLLFKFPGSEGGPDEFI
jgi:hypothetical protein